MKVFVKICGLADSESVAAAVDAGADGLGFVFADSPRRVTPVQALQLTREIPAHLKRFAVTRHPQSKDLDEVFRVFVPDFLQTDVEDFSAIALPENCTPVPVYRDSMNNTLRPAAGTRILFEGRDSGIGRTANWDKAKNLARECELILAGGLDTDNVATAIKHVRPWGVDVSSGVESKRGVKDPALIRAFVARVRALETTIE